MNHRSVDIALRLGLLRGVMLGQPGGGEPIRAAIHTGISVSSCGFFASLTEEGNAKVIKRTQLERWKDARPGSPPRAEIAVVCELQNNTSDASDLVVPKYMEFIVAPTSQYGIDDLESMKQSVGWAGATELLDDIKMVKVPWLRPGERRSITIPGFDLRPMLSQYDGRSDTLWPWWMRVNVRVETRMGERIATGSALLPMIPSDERLKGRVGGPVERHPPIPTTPRKD